MSKSNVEKYISQIGAVKAPGNFQQETARRVKERLAVPPKKNRRMLKFVAAPALAVVLVCALLFSNVFEPVNTVKASENLMEGITANKIDADPAVSGAFVSATADFSVRLFQKSVRKNTNSLVSPLSVSLALGMTANGAVGNTLTQFQNVLGGGMELSELDRNYYDLAKSLVPEKDSKIQIGNSIWYRDRGIQVKKDFLQRNADFFGAGAFQLDFTKKAAADKINSWVKVHTAGKIDKMVDSIDSDTMMYLINTLYFEDDWQRAYDSSRNAEFKSPDGAVSVPFMKSIEQYIHDENSQGMLKYFKDSRYAFAAVLPNEGVSMENYIGGMTGEKFLSLMKSADGTADCSLPKFKYEYQIDLNNPLKALGLTDGFSSQLADFSGMGNTSLGKLYIGDVLHKTFIQVDEAGAKAGAATEVQMSATSMPIDVKNIDFNRPFVYAIIDTQTDLPIFLGTVSNPAK